MNEELKKFSAGLAEAVETAVKGTVTVRSRRRLPASGIALDGETILTAAHVIEDEDNIVVVLPSGAESKAELLGYDPNSDLAVLKLADGGATAAGIEEAVSVGELVLSLGRPFGEIQASLGTLSAKGGPSSNHRGGMLEGHFRTDATPYPGFSGGPLINVSGQVVGINTSGLGMPIAIPIAIALKIAETLKKHGTIKRGYLGITGQPVELPAGAAEALGREQATGLLIAGIEEESPAGASDLMIGDILVGLAGKPVASHRQLLGYLSGEIVGTETEMEVLRGGKRETLKVTVGERPEHFEGEGGHGRRGRMGGHGRHFGRMKRGRHSLHGGHRRGQGHGDDED
jgi:S1-C subfamily serine protease